MARLRSKKEVVQLSEKQSRKSIEFLVPQFLTLQSIVDNFEEKVGVAMISLNQKIQTVEELFQESCKYCFHKRKVCIYCIWMKYQNMLKQLLLCCGLK